MPIATSELVGREPELEWFAEHIAPVGHGAAVVLVGEAGVGKTRLLDTALRLAEGSGRRVLRGRAVAGPQLPFRPLTEALAGATRRFGLPKARELLPFRGPLGHVIAEWPTPRGGMADAVLVGEGLLRLLRILGGAEGVVMGLDDLQWADPDSLSVIEYLCEHGPTDNIAIISTVLDDPSIDSGALSRLRILAGRGAATWLRLGRLSRDDIGAMCRSLLQGPVLDAVIQFVSEHSDGLPLVVEELLTSLVDQHALVRDADGWRLAGVPTRTVPLTVEQSVQRRLAELSSEARPVIELAAVLGRSFEWRLLLQALGNCERVVEGALENAADLGLLEVVEDGYRFRHALTRDAVLAQLSPPARARLATLALDALEDDPSRASRALSISLAEAAGQPERAALLHAEMAEQAIAVGAVASAAASLHAALKLDGDPERQHTWRLRLLEVLIDAGRLREAEELAAALPERHALITLALAESATVRHDWQAVESLLGIAAANDDGDELIGLRRRLLEAELAFGQFRQQDAAELIERAAQVALGLDDARLRCEALIAAGRLMHPFSAEAARARLGEALTLANGRGLLRERAAALASLADLDVLAVSDDDVCEEALGAAYDAGAVGLVAASTHNLAMIASLRHRLVDAERWADECVEISRRYRLGWLEAAGLTKRAFVAALRGQRDAAEEFLAPAERIAQGDARGLSLMEGNVRAAAYLNDGQLESAERCLIRAWELAAQHHLEPRPYLGLRVLVTAASGGDPEPLATELEESGRSWPPVIAGTLAAARSIRSAGEPDRALELATAGFHLLRSTPWYLAVARRFVGQEQRRRSWGDGIATLSAAESFFREAGLAVAAEECCALMGAAHRLPAGRVPGEFARYGVTAREVDVLELVADGLTNRQIAERLVLSVRTVEKHVERLMMKTGRPNRAALAAFVATSPRNT